MSSGAFPARPLFWIPACLALGVAQADENEEWDVQDPPGPANTVELDVEEGTWMNLDVSPDGEEIAFDLLGDIYIMPREGGEAEPLTSGMAWNMQPRFSPDGERIAFTSDREGGDNIWVMDRDGSDARQITAEDFRLVNNPTWTPDGDYIAARKHYTGTRSLGAGEIWLYHHGGNHQGLQMIERPNDQQDINEPAFSPDGDYLYYTQDTTPGDQFEYDKDPHPGIYDILRLDRDSGDIDTYISGTGGAIHPRPSPDGEKIAFVRRVGGDTAIFLRDIESGRERKLYDGLERDMQEIWAIHGVYANMAWTPDSESLIFWAEGGIHEIDINEGEAQEIAFRVEDEREIREAQRPPIDPNPDEVDAQMLRWVTVSPQGDRVVYESRGHLYVRDLPDGEPERLTTQEDHFEYYPSFSRDGSQVVYVSWDDEDLGAVRVVSADGAAEGRTVTEEPGHYLEPSFSPEGDQVTFRKTSGSNLLSPWWGEREGLYVASATGGEMEKISSEGEQPHFAADNDRVFFMRYRGYDARELASVETDGSEERTHFVSTWASNFRVSPDQDWVAFQERYNAYVAPFAVSGQTVHIGPDTQDIPVERISKEAGDYIHWVDDDTVAWSTGPELFEREMDETFAFLNNETEEDETPEPEGRHIGYSSEADVPEGSVALVGGQVITMNGDEVIEDGTVVVEGNRIAEVGPSDEVNVPADAHEKDVSGKTVMPGLIDAHWHGSMGSNQILPQENWNLHASLAFGVTTFHDPSNDTHMVFAAHEMGRTGEITAPRIFSTGRILYGATTDFTVEVDELDDAREHLGRLQSAGAFSVKSYNQPRRDQRQMIMEAAREKDMHVHPEGGALFQHNMTMIQDGHTGIEHSLSVPHTYEDVLQFWSGTDVGYTPTLSVGYGGYRGENWWYVNTDVHEHERLTDFVPREVIDPVARRPGKAPKEEYGHFDIANHSRQLMERGVPVNIGAHGQREGLAAHWEIWMFAQGGMEPMEALKTATVNPAEYLGMDEDLGRLEEGMLADIIVLDRDPLENIRNSEHVRYTMVNGRIYDASTMDEVGNHPERRGSFWFERD